MAVSGSKNFTITRADIVEAAHRKTGVFDASEDLSGEESSAANLALNLLVKEWVADGADMFLREEITLFLQPGTKYYLIGGTAKATTSYVETTLSADEATSQTVLSVTSSTGMTAADNVGIKLDDDSIHWTTIVSVDSSIQITITDALPSAAASGNKVYAYTTAALRPQRLIHAYTRDTNDIDSEVNIIGEKEYQSLSSKGSAGAPVSVFYRQTISSGTLFVWPVDGGASVDKLVLIVDTPPYDFDAASDNPGFPIEWGAALIWGLAAEIAPEFGISGQELSDLRAMAQYKLEKMLNYDVENASVIFGLDQ